MDDLENKDEVVEKNENTDQESVNETETKSEDRPERNYKAELDRKNREIERLRQEHETLRSNSVQKRDQNDLSTWSDHELKAIKNSNDPSVLPYKDQAEEVLLERKVRSIRERERMQEKRAMSDLELRSKYPDALDSNSELSQRIEQVMYELDLQKSPAGRLAAAKIAAAELGKGRSKSSALDREAEKSRQRDVKSQMVDGDRSKPTEPKNGPKKLEELEKRLRSDKTSEAAVGEVMDLKGIRQKFSKFWGNE